MPNVPASSLVLGLLATHLGAGQAQAQAQAQARPRTVYISEVMTSNKGYVVGTVNSTPDWIELANYGTEWVDLDGFRITDKCDFDSGYVIPGGQNIGPNERKIFLADGSGRTINNSIFLDFRLSSSGETVCAVIVSNRGRQLHRTLTQSLSLCLSLSLS
jgi:hypothetical protein